MTNGGKLHELHAVTGVFCYPIGQQTVINAGSEDERVIGAGDGDRTALLWGASALRCRAPLSVPVGHLRVFGKLLFP